MALVFAIIMWLLLAMLVLVAASAITPVFVRVYLTTSPQLTYRVEMRAFAGLAPRLAVVVGPPKGSVAKPDPEPAKSRQRARSRQRVHAAVIRALPPLIMDILERLHLVELRIDADYGLGDPDVTGRLCGLLMPLQYGGPLPASVSLDLRPDFTGTCLNGSVAAVFRITVASLFVPISRFVWRVYGPQR